ncbi:MAG: hypothetical protein R2861_01835 [Desulfobacterales bacterium]
MSFGITGPDVIAGLAVVNLKYLASGFLYVYDLKSDTIIEAGKTASARGQQKIHHLKSRECLLRIHLRRSFHQHRESADFRKV